VVVTDNGERPTPENSRLIVPNDPSGRASIVFYNQATMFYGPETGYDTLGNARKNGGSGITNFHQDILNAFAKTTFSATAC
jgi:hypothetical protein